MSRRHEHERESHAKGEGKGETRAREPSPHQIEALHDQVGNRGLQRLLRGGGTALDAGLRGPMERHFGRDLGHVRVHAGEGAATSARSLDAAAYAVGDHIVFGEGQYQPGTAEGRMVVAHEIAHSLQQRGAAPLATPEVGADDSREERHADRAALAFAAGIPYAVAPVSGPARIQRMRLGRGGYSRALADFSGILSRAVDRVAGRLLRRSSIFMSLVHTLDQHYLWTRDVTERHFDWWRRQGNPDLSQFPAHDPHGILIPPGPAANLGHPEIEILIDREGAHFEPGPARERQPSGTMAPDAVFVGHLDLEGFIQDLVHETVHAHRHVTGSGPSPTDLAGSIASLIQEEIDVRNQEELILNQILAVRPSLHFRPIGSRVPAEVERDLSPGIGLTYLQAGYFDFRLREQQAADGLTDQQAAAIRAQVEHLSDDALFDELLLYHGPPATSYRQVVVLRESARRRWREFHRDHAGDDPATRDAAAARERELQRWRFEGRTDYSPLPP